MAKGTRRRNQRGGPVEETRIKRRRPGARGGGSEQPDELHMEAVDREHRSFGWLLITAVIIVVIGAVLAIAILAFWPESQSEGGKVTIGPFSVDGVLALAIFGVSVAGAGLLLILGRRIGRVEITDLDAAESSVEENNVNPN